ncbi:helix-turn-helix transcriptional regulator [Nocardioides sp.]|jgi:transcriptional regulator with XRE-family HTH domain|uniref:helix-turn-helix domain-containing protein n=1 Tax=Nocardioides sp. TaxID=35761 RepID=UPI002611F070|nr:helix-turn-helix transcriptional regulator [Nocardioides sp.]
MAKSKVGQTVESLGDYLKEQRVASRLSLRQLAVQAGVSNPYLSQIERGLRKPSAEVLQQIARALRISAEQLYVRAGIVSPDDGVGGSVEVAVLSDTGLTERQKQSLLDVYSSFIAMNGAEAEQAAEAEGSEDSSESDGAEGADIDQHIDQHGSTLPTTSAPQL